MQSIDLNCDLGEGAGNDHQIMALISSANIACGFHAGDEQTIWNTIALACKHQVAIGAHVSFLDKENFGRSEMNLPAEDVYELVTQQLLLFAEIASDFDVTPGHVKPHGALYNMSAKDPELAKTIAQAVKDFDPGLILYGLSGSCSITAAKEIGLRAASEVFADRRYNDDGSLVARSSPKALIEDDDLAVAQVLQIIGRGTVASLSGKTVQVVADTICIHGDGKKAVEFASLINRELKNNLIEISSILK